MKAFFIKIFNFFRMFISTIWKKITEAKISGSFDINGSQVQINVDNRSTSVPMEEIKHMVRFTKAELDGINLADLNQVGDFLREHSELSKDYNTVAILVSESTIKTLVAIKEDKKKGETEYEISGVDFAQPESKKPSEETDEKEVQDGETK